MAGQSRQETNTMPLSIYTQTLYGSWGVRLVDGAGARLRLGIGHVCLQPSGAEGDNVVTTEPRLDVRLFKKVDGFTLDVAWQVWNEVAVLFGYSGSGKSMTLRMIAGLVKPDAGRVSLDGEVLIDCEDHRWVPPQARPFGYVGQDLALFPHMDVARQHRLRAQGNQQGETTRARR